MGKELAANALFISIARLLWAANLERARDESGEEVPVDTETLAVAQKRSCELPVLELVKQRLHRDACTLDLADIPDMAGALLRSIA